MVEIKFIKTKDIRLNKGQIPGVNANPREISKEKFEKLKQSIVDNPEMLDLRELMVYEHEGKFVCIGGNMRFRACKKLGYKEIPCKIIPHNASVEQLNAYIIKDNNGFGEWDWDALANDWNPEDLANWGLDLSWNPEESEEDNESKYTAKVVAPLYEPRGTPPQLCDCIDKGKYSQLMDKINSSEIDPEIKDFLTTAAYRHVVFNYEKIADYYAHAPKDIQELMEDSALVIIDMNQAIENGFVKVTKVIQSMWDTDHKEEEENEDDAG